VALFCTTDVLGGLKVEGKEEISKAGRGGLQKYQTTISFTVGGIAMALYVFLEVLAPPLASRSIPSAHSR